MSKYSEFFLVSQPKYGGIAPSLRLRSYGSWLTEESWLREEHAKRRAEFSLKAIRLARRIAMVKNIDEDLAFDMLSDVASNSEVLGEFAEEAGSLFLSLPSQQAQLNELVTKFFQNRGEVHSNGQWQATGDWSPEDTGKLTSVMLEAVELFMANEDKGTVIADDEEEAPKEQG